MGDVYHVNVGSNARQVVVGANVVQIGHLTLPTFPLLLVAGLVAAYMGWQLWQQWQQRGPTQMSGEFNIAIAEFGQMDANGRIQPSAKGESLSRVLYGRINQEFATLFTEVNAQLWHDEVGLGIKLGPITGQTAAERRANADALAERINAHVIIYGHLEPTADGDQLTPEFYVRDLREAGDLVGAYQLGAPIPVPASLDTLADSLKVNPRLSDRTKALALFTLGLAWEFAGYPDRALTQFQAAQQLPDWRDDEGKEILYLFLSREAYFLWLDGQVDEAAVYEPLQLALRLNPDYGRAYVGLGNYHREKAERLRAELATYKQAEGLASSTVQATYTAVQAEISQAVDAYQQAIALAPADAADQTVVKAHLALGTTLLLQAVVAEEMQKYGPATDYYQQALTVFQEGLALTAVDDYRHQGLAHASLGALYQSQAALRSRRTDLPPGDAETAILLARAVAEYKLCVQVAAQDPADWFLQQVKDENCVPQLTQLGQ
ncbi:MAG: hypothetical protein BroJett015_28980 [Chloroflexota bacterium]|nr:MAG: hypothetical protein BroJett015_28980 [Chloroflexota bacterium]